MAKANLNVKRSAVEGEVVLTLTPTEAVVLRSILASCCTGAQHAPKSASQIYYALTTVPTVGIVASNIHFKDDSNASVEHALENWNLKS